METGCLIDRRLKRKSTVYGLSISLLASSEIGRFVCATNGARGTFRARTCTLESDRAHHIEVPIDVLELISGMLPKYCKGLWVLRGHPSFSKLHCAD